MLHFEWKADKLNLSGEATVSDVAKLHRALQARKPSAESKVDLTRLRWVDGATLQVLIAMRKSYPTIQFLGIEGEIARHLERAGALDMLRQRSP